MFKKLVHWVTDEQGEMLVEMVAGNEERAKAIVDFGKQQWCKGYWTGAAYCIAGVFVAEMIEAGIDIYKTNKKYKERVDILDDLNKELGNAIEKENTVVEKMKEKVKQLEELVKLDKKRQGIEES